MREPDARRRAESGRSRDVRVVSVFAAAVLVLFALVQSNRVYEHGVVPFTAAIAAVSSGVLHAIGERVDREGTVVTISSGESVRTVVENGAIRRTGGTPVDIRDGCNAVYVTLVFLAGVAAFPATARGRLIGVVGGILAIQAVNITRIVALVLIVKNHPDLFDAAHSFIAQILVIFFTIVIFVIWADRFSGHAHKDAASRTV